VKADHASQLLLLDVQAADTAIAQLTHKRKNLPELAALADVGAKDTELHNELIDAETRLDDVAADQTRLEAEIDTVRSRAARDEMRLTGGGLPGKELESLQHEIATLARRQTTLEDELLEVLERREQLEAELAGLRVRRDDLAEQTAGLESAREAEHAVIDASIADRTAERLRLAQDVAPDLLALYEKAREHGGGVGAAMLKARRCEGCHIELAGSELSAVRAAGPDEVVRCENCRRILVRTAESGL